MSFTFGQSTTTTASTGTAGFSFGAVPSSTTGLSGLGSTSTGALPFGTAAAASTAAGTGVTKAVRFDTPSTGSGLATSAPALSSLLATTTATLTQPGSTTSTLTFGAGNTLFGNTSTGGTTTSGGLLSGGLCTSSAASAPSLGLTFGTANSILATTSASTGLGGVAPSTTVSQGGFGGLCSGTLSHGLGGTDPKTTAGCAAATGSAKTCDAKAVKETCVPPEVLTTVEEFTKHVKNQKGVRENIARMSSKPLFRIQEDIRNLRQQLLLVTGGLQRNAAAIEKLKRETAQELKNAEIAQRTKETPPGLQYENTAPSLYFQHIANEFDSQMQLYRQQIVETENYLASAEQSSALSPQDLSLLLNKLHEGFIALAAQLQVAHEAVKEQKEVYLNYRRTFHGDTTNVFDRHGQPQETAASRALYSVPTTVGPTPFSSMSNAAAVAMATALNRTQPVTGSTQTSFGLLQGSAVGGCTGGSIFNQNANTTGSCFGSGSLLGSSLAATTQSSLGFTSGGLSSQPFGGFNSLGTSSGLGAVVSPFGANQSTLGGFALQKTPSGSKRGKNS